MKSNTVLCKVPIHQVIRTSEITFLRRFLSLHGHIYDMVTWVSSCSLSMCLNIFFGLFEVVHVLLKQDSNKLTQCLNVTLWGSVRPGKLSVNVEINDFVRNILRSKFHLWCYILLSGTRWCTHAYLRRGYATIGATGAETSLLLNAYCAWDCPYPIHAADGITLVIVVAWRCYGFTTITKST